MVDQKTLILGIPNTVGIEIKVKLIPAILSYHLSQKLLKSQKTQRLTGTHFWTRSWPLQTQPWRTPRQGRNLRPGRKHRYVNLLSTTIRNQQLQNDLQANRNSTRGFVRPLIGLSVCYNLRGFFYSGNAKKV